LPDRIIGLNAAGRIQPTTATLLAGFSNRT